MVLSHSSIDFFILSFRPAAEMDASKDQAPKMSKSYIQKNGPAGAFLWKQSNPGASYICLLRYSTLLTISYKYH